MKPADHEHHARHISLDPGCVMGLVILFALIILGSANGADWTVLIP